jgi:hypothetical protein
MIRRRPSYITLRCSFALSPLLIVAWARWSQRAPDVGPGTFLALAILSSGLVLYWIEQFAARVDEVGIATFRVNIRWDEVKRAASNGVWLEVSSETATLRLDLTQFVDPSSLLELVGRKVARDALGTGWPTRRRLRR